MLKKSSSIFLIGGITLLVFILVGVVFIGTKNFDSTNKSPNKISPLNKATNIATNLSATNTATNIATNSSASNTATNPSATNTPNTQNTAKNQTTSVQDIKSKNDLNVLVLGDAVASGFGIKDPNSKWTNIIKNEFAKKSKLKLKIKALDDILNNTFGGWIDYNNEIKKDYGVFDVVIICLGKYDTKYDDLEFSAPYEKLVHNILKQNPGVKIVTVAQYGIKDEQYYIRVKKIADYYKLIYADMPMAIKNSGKKPDSLFLWGGVPNVEGSLIYGSYIADLITDAIAKPSKYKELSLNALYPEASFFGSCYRIGTFNNGFAQNPKTDINGRRYFKGNSPGEFLETNILGSIIGVHALVGDYSGILKIYLNDILVSKIDLYSSDMSNKKFFITRKMDYSYYRLRMEISEEKNQNSKGNQAFIFGVITNTKESDIDVDLIK